MSGMNTDARRRAHRAYTERLTAQGIKPVNLRLKAPIRAAVERYAKANKLSLNAAYEALIEAGLAAQACRRPDPGRSGQVLQRQALDRLPVGPKPYVPNLKKGK